MNCKDRRFLLRMAASGFAVIEWRGCWIIRQMKANE